MSGHIGQQVLIEYRPGAASNIAAQSVARAKPDGYTVFIGGRPNTIHKVMYERLDYDFARDLVPMGLLATVPYVVLVAAYSPIADLEDIMTLAGATRRGPLGTQARHRQGRPDHRGSGPARPGPGFLVRPDGTCRHTRACRRKVGGMPSMRCS
ncbi:hypothetical protein BAU07_04185 [Bordetella flabilis]|uniref:Uncharacterized protein n=1 Tax=Bordetella flabilis TaxID=463014 RepID=A0A193G9W5_9BORD|nr:hypothetical protein BAU07_04185 [Bordetella flabilis]